MRQSDARPRNRLAWRGRRAGFGLGCALVCLCALQACDASDWTSYPFEGVLSTAARGSPAGPIWVADDQVVFDRDPQGRWTEVLRGGPSRTVTRLRSSGGKLMVSERLLDRGRWEASLWVGR